MDITASSFTKPSCIEQLDPDYVTAIQSCGLSSCCCYINSSLLQCENFPLTRLAMLQDLFSVWIRYSHCWHEKRFRWPSIHNILYSTLPFWLDHFYYILTAQTFLLSCCRVRMVAVSTDGGHVPPPNLTLSSNCIKDKLEVLLISTQLGHSTMNT